MPRKPKRNPTTAELLVQAENDLREAQARVDYYLARLEPLQQKLFAELAATGVTLDDDEPTGRPGGRILGEAEFGPPESDRRRLA